MRRRIKDIIARKACISFENTIDRTRGHAYGSALPGTQETKQYRQQQQQEEKKTRKRNVARTKQIEHSRATPHP